ncbi:hypothetical protein H0H81_007771 [Sphagnurus paluster]|uniref:Uncharacterized protein n=1 Tax=Sphagnurus paluster TaxID=117069 RepID=A0A9P7FQ89_9AGAR|nr:hypothetical protein H0H81_007771 [Sphagnurus paluster]
MEAGLKSHQNNAEKLDPSATHPDDVKRNMIASTRLTQTNLIMSNTVPPRHRKIKIPDLVEKKLMPVNNTPCPFSERQMFPDDLETSCRTHLVVISSLPWCFYITDFWKLLCELGLSSTIEEIVLFQNRTVSIGFTDSHSADAALHTFQELQEKKLLFTLVSGQHLLQIYRWPETCNQDTPPDYTQSTASEVNEDIPNKLTSQAPALHDVVVDENSMYSPAVSPTIEDEETKLSSPVRLSLSDAAAPKGRISSHSLYTGLNTDVYRESSEQSSDSESSSSSPRLSLQKRSLVVPLLTGPVNREIRVSRATTSLFADTNISDSTEDESDVQSTSESELEDGPRTSLQNGTYSRKRPNFSLRDHSRPLALPLQMKEHHSNCLDAINPNPSRKLPKVPFNRPRRVLVPESDSLPIVTISMRADAQFFSRDKRVGLDHHPHHPIVKDSMTEGSKTTHLLTCLTPARSNDEVIRFFTGAQDKSIKEWTVREGNVKSMTITRCLIVPSALGTRDRKLFYVTGSKLQVLDLDHPKALPTIVDFSNNIYQIHIPEVDRSTEGAPTCPYLPEDIQMGVSASGTIGTPRYVQPRLRTE